MQAFIVAFFCIVTLSDFAVARFGLPPLLRFLPEMCSAIVVVYVLVAGTRERFQLVALKYWLVFGALAIVVLCGIANDSAGAGPLIAGLRFYFRAAPLFFLPMVLPPTEDQLRRQLKWLLWLSFLQLPIAIYQRYIVISQERFTGDEVRGTIMDSGILSMFLICGALVLTGMMLKRRISIVRYAILFLILLFPTTINETKVTVLFVPFGLFIVFILGAEPGKRLQFAGLSLAILVVFGAIFVPVYNKMEEGMKSQVDIVDFFTNEKTFSSYLVSHGKEKGVGIGGSRAAHRGESITIPIEYLAKKDPVLLAFGLGLGNVSPSQSGKGFEGPYFSLFESILTISFSSFVLEFGLFGIILIAVLNWMIFVDSYAVSRRDNSLTGGLATGWTGIVGIFVVAMFYNNFHFFASVTYLFWYLSGVVCARRMALRHEPVPVAARAARLRPNAIGG